MALRHTYLFHYKTRIIPPGKIYFRVIDSFVYTITKQISLHDLFFERDNTQSNIIKMSDWIITQIIALFETNLVKYEVFENISCLFCDSITWILVF